MSINQKHIADSLNLSVITVSRALRDHPDLAADTKAKVLRKAKELGYRKLDGLIRSNAPTPRRAGILFYENAGSERQDPLASGVKRAIFLSLQKECQRLEVETLIETPVCGDTPLLVKNRTIQAAFIFGRYTASAIDKLGDLPAIAVSSFIEHGQLPRIVADNANGIRLVTEHLIELGHRRIAFVGINETRSRIFEERAGGYIATMHRNGLTPRVEMPDAGVLPSVEKLRSFTALVCASDGLACQVHEAMSQAGISLPGECSVVGFDNLPTRYPCKMTTYAPDWELMGKTAAGLMFSNPMNIRRHGITITVPGRLIVRDSSGPLLHEADLSAPEEREAVKQGNRTEDAK